MPAENLEAGRAPTFELGYSSAKASWVSGFDGSGRPAKRRRGVQQVDPGKLVGIRLLSSLNAKAFRSLEKTCTWRRYDANEQIVDRSSSSRDVLFVVEGRVHIVNYSLSGREIAYATVSAGGYFGELSAIDGEPRSATVVALERCLLAGITPELFNDLLLPHADIAIAVMRGLARIIRICDDRIMDLSTLGAVQRVYVELLRRAKPDPVTAGSWNIYPMPTQTTRKPPRHGSSTAG